MSELSLEARIIEKVDVFQALAQRRPYRDSLEPDKIMEILVAESEKGKLDQGMIKEVGEHIQECWLIAKDGI